MIEILSIVTITLLSMLVVSFLIDNEGLGATSIVLLILVALGGWGIACIVSIKKEIIIPAKVVEIVRGKHMLAVTTDQKDDKGMSDTHIISGYEMDLIKDSTKFYWKIKYNQYNFEVSKELIFK